MTGPLMSRPGTEHSLLLDALDFSGREITSKLVSRMS
jgi:hypothetical protein